MSPDPSAPEVLLALRQANAIAKDIIKTIATVGIVLIVLIEYVLWRLRNKKTPGLNRGLL